MKIKKILPKKTTIIKSIIIIFLLSIVSTYVTSALANQKRITPDNPFQEEVNGFYSEVPLFGGYLDLSSSDKEDEKEEEKQEEKTDEPKQDKNNQKDEKNNETGSKQDNQQSSNEGKKSDRDLQEDSNPTTDENKDSEHIEIIAKEDNDVEDIEGINNFFTTSIKQNEVVANNEYQFIVEQLDHDYELQNLDISIDSKDGKVESVSEDLHQPVQIMLQLSKGENNITISATYEDENKVSFTVLRSYTVIYDEKEIIIETDLKNQAVSDDKITFIASAKQGEEIIPLTVQLHQDNNQDELTEIEKHKYTADLQEGANKFVLLATSNQRQAEEVITIDYEKPVPPELKIETNLDDYHEKTVKDEKLEFTAMAYDGEEVVTLHVVHDGDTIKGSDGNYRVNLQEGANTFELKAEKDSYSETSTYLVYYEPEVTDGEVEEKEPNENEPEITIYDIKDGETVKNSVRTFHVKVKNYKGESITKSGKISATNNGETVPVDWPDSDQISFKLAINNGENEITVHAEDEEGNKASKTITIQGDIDEDGAPIGTATVSVEATTVGLGYLISPHQVEIYQGERASYVLDRVLKNAGIKYMNTGSLDSKFYMSAVHKSGISSNIDIPEDLLSTLEEHNITVDLTNIHPDVLGELDLTQGSGWMYSVNGIYANVGFADYYLKDGDELRIRYTLDLGNDIGLGKNNYHKQW